MICYTRFYTNFSWYLTLIKFIELNHYLALMILPLVLLISNLVIIPLYHPTVKIVTYNFAVIYAVILTEFKLLLPVKDSDIYAISGYRVLAPYK